MLTQQRAVSGMKSNLLSKKLTNEFGENETLSKETPLMRRKARKS